MKEYFQTNKTWIITLIALSISVASILVGGGMAYQSIMGEIAGLHKQAVQQDQRLIRVEALITVAPVVEMHTARIGKIEEFMMESAKDRAGLNVKIDDVTKGIQSMRALLETHVYQR